MASSGAVDISEERLLKLLRQLFVKTEGRGWAPPDPSHPLILAAVEQGFLRRVDGRCGFERLRDACVAWTPAGRHAVEARS